MAWDKRARIAFALRVGLAVGLLVLAASWVDWARFGEVVRDAQLIWLLPVALVTAADRFWMAGKWWYLLRGLGIPVRFFEALQHYLVGGLVGLSLQWQLGGDIARAVSLGQRSGQQSAVVTSVVFEKVAGAAAGGVWATIALGLLFSNVELGVWRSLFLLVGCATLCAAIGPLVASSRAFGNVLEATGRLLPTPIARWIDKLRRSLDRLARMKRVALVFFLLTLGEQVVPLINVALAKEVFALEIRLVDVLMVVPVIVFLSRLPISVESLGVREGLFVLLFGLLGISAAESFALGLATRVVDLAVGGVGALVCLGARGDATTFTNRS